MAQNPYSINEIQSLMQQRLEDQRSFSDKLKERSAQRQQQVAQYSQQVTPQELNFKTPEGYARDPQSVYNAGQMFRQSLISATEPLQQQYAQSQGIESDLLSQIASLAQNREQMDLNKQKMQYDQGMVIDPDTGEVTQGVSTDPAIEAYAGQIISGKAKLSNVPLDQRGQVAKLLEDKSFKSRFYENAPLVDLISEKEKTKLQEQQETLLTIEEALNQFKLRTGGFGTGPIEQFIPGIVAGKDTRELRAQSEKVKSQFLRAISGATVSDAEVKRLSKFLPSSNKTEEQNREDLQRLADGIRANQEIFELSKRNNITVTEAYNQFGPEILAKYDQQGVGNNPSSQPGPSPQANEFVIEEVK